MGWLPHDVPWEEHAKYYGGCKFLHRMKGPTFAADVRRKTKTPTSSRALRRSVRIAERRDSEGRDEPNSGRWYWRLCCTPEWMSRRRANEQNWGGGGRGSDLCKICFAHEANVVFVPCGHVASCGVCSPNFLASDCPICRRKIDEIVRVFYS